MSLLLGHIAFKATSKLYYFFCQDCIAEKASNRLIHGDNILDFLVREIENIHKQFKKSKLEVIRIIFTVDNGHLTIWLLRTPCARKSRKCRIPVFCPTLRRIAYNFNGSFIVWLLRIIVFMLDVRCQICPCSRCKQIPETDQITEINPTVRTYF